MKKFFISCDIEGVAGICVWDETMTGTVEYEYFRKQMTREVAAAARVLIAAGYEVWIKDAHATARNLLPDLLPENIRLIRNWSGHPYQMMEKLDDSFAGCAMIGYHSAAGKEGNPLAHSFSSRKVYEMRLNGKKFSELEWNNRIARLEGVPLVFVSGDRELCAIAQEDEPNVVTVATQEGFGNATLSLHPEVAAEKIADGMRAALESEASWKAQALEGPFTLELEFHYPRSAYAASFYPGAEKIDERTVRYTSSDFHDVLIAFKYLMAAA